MAIGILLRQALMRRVANWPSRLAALVEEVRLRPFAWGKHDCCLWAASAVEAITSMDPAIDLRGTYRSAKSALAILESLGGLEAVGAWCGPEIEVAFASIGDIGLVMWPDGTRSLAVSAGHSWMCAGETGLVNLPLQTASHAWGVGRE